MPADHQIRPGPRRMPRQAVRWLGSGRCVYWVPQCVSTTTVSARLASAAMSEVIRRRSSRSSGPVLGGMSSRLVPGLDDVAAGDSPMESVARSRSVRRRVRGRRVGGLLGIGAGADRRDLAGEPVEVCRSARSP